jgi:bacillithiol synthase
MEITYQNSGYFTPIIIDYLNEKSSLKPMYNRFPKIENFDPETSGQISEKSLNYNVNDNFNQNFKRKILVEELNNQYLNLVSSETTLKNIKLLNSSNTFTITTGHQLNLFTGPLYFLYKIISTINLCSELKSKYPNQNFVPIYWMATEDHDFDEINYFSFNGKKFRWNKQSSSPVGRLSTDGLKEVFEVFAKELGSGNNANFIKDLFEQSYLKHSNLADATRFLANELFGKYGLVILDADNRNLKSIFIPYIKEELLNQKSFSKVNETIERLKDYSIQVNPRDINLFYILDNLRERIIFENGIYKVNNTKIEFSEVEIFAELTNFPERFSPNVILRPLYQEVILPNLCYIGGGGEIAYWLELKSTFEHHKVTFPMLLLRNSALIANEKQITKMDKLDLSWQDLFQKQNDLLKSQTIKKSSFEIDFTTQKEHLKKQFEDLYKIANQTDKSFIGAVKAQEVKQIKGLENLEKRLLKAQKRVLADDLERITNLQNELFPNQSLQERQANFSEFYLDNGEKLIEKLISELKPLSNEFNVVCLLNL